MSKPFNTRARWLQPFLLLSPTTLFLLVFFCGPLAIMITYSLLEPGIYGGVVWNFYDQNYGRIFGWADGMFEEFDPIYLQTFMKSVRLALITVCMTLLICYPAAFWISRLPRRARSICMFLITLPFFVSMIVRLYAWLLILRPTGVLNQALMSLGLISEPLEMMYTEGAVIMGMTYIFLPFMFLPIYASIEKLPTSLIEASQDLGASQLRTFFRVILPLTLPGVISGAIIVFIPSLGNFIVPGLLGGAKVMMVGNLIEQQFLYARNWPFGAALSFMIMGSMFILLVIYVRIQSRSNGQRRGGA
ncbi:MAG: spermidine/putrescine ABC transporter permease [Oceanospirillaceae bacterium]|nr:spermidine/putrescine ABC transporter permease [Oceanospirillaceae bacterium]